MIWRWPIWSPDSLAESAPQIAMDSVDSIDSQLSELLDSAFAADDSEQAADESPMQQDAVATGEASQTAPPRENTTPAKQVSTSEAPERTVPGALESDFANRTGKAKDRSTAAHRRRR